MWHLPNHKIIDSTPARHRALTTSTHETVAVHRHGFLRTISYSRRLRLLTPRDLPPNEHGTLVANKNHGDGRRDRHTISQRDCATARSTRVDRLRSRPEIHIKILARVTPTHGYQTVDVNSLPPSNRWSIGERSPPCIWSHTHAYRTESTRLGQPGSHGRRLRSSLHSNLTTDGYQPSYPIQRKPRSSGSNNSPNKHS